MGKTPRAVERNPGRVGGGAAQLDVPRDYLLRRGHPKAAARRGCQIPGCRQDVESEPSSAFILAFESVFSPPRADRCTKIISGDHAHTYDRPVDPDSTQGSHRPMAFTRKCRKRQVNLNLFIPSECDFSSFDGAPND